MQRIFLSVIDRHQDEKSGELGLLSTFVEVVATNKSLEDVIDLATELGKYGVPATVLVGSDVDNAEVEFENEVVNKFATTMQVEMINKAMFGAK